jgi:phosphatidylglycerol lysyltransferase
MVAAVHPPWRLRLAARLFVYVGVSYLFLGSLADLEHLWAVAVALPLGRRVVGHHAVGTPMWAGLRNRRLLAASGLGVIAVAEIVLLWFPADGPLGSTYGPDASTWGVALTVTVAGVVVNGLRKGRRPAWWVAVALCTLNVAARLVAGIDGPLAITATALWAVEAAVLVANHRAFAARRAAATRADRDGVRALLERHGGGTLSWMATWPSNAHVRTPNGRSRMRSSVHPTTVPSATRATCPGSGSR